MYESHFGLTESPFRLTPDTNFFLGCSHYQEALNTLLVAVSSGEGFVKITGEVGSGKTMLCRKFLATLDKRFIVVNISHPSLDSYHLLQAIAEELDIPIEADMGQSELLRLLTKTLFYDSRLHGHIVVCLDEAQAISMECLETLRLLTNLQTEKCRLLQVVLFGQPELDEHLAVKSMRQLRQRITFQHNLGGLLEDEVTRYLDHRLKVAGFKGKRLFSKAAAHQLYRKSGGIPRLVNILAHKSLLLVYGEGAREVLPRHVNQAAADTQEAKHGWLVRWFNKFSSIFRLTRQNTLATSLSNKMLQSLEKRNGAGESLGDAGKYLHAVMARRSNARLYVPVLLCLFVAGGVWVYLSVPYGVSASTQTNSDLPVEPAVVFNDAKGIPLENSSEESLANIQVLPPLSDKELSETQLFKAESDALPIPQEKPVIQASMVVPVVEEAMLPINPADSESLVVVDVTTVEVDPVFIASASDDIAEPIKPIPEPQHIAVIKPTNELVFDEKIVKQVNTQQRAEYEFQQAVILMQQGRLNAALEKYGLTLLLDAAHEAARQAMVGLLLESGRLNEAESILREGLQLNSEQIQFAKTLSRIQVERGDIKEALATLNNALPQALDQPEYRVFIGALLQHQSRHNEAIGHYLAAVNLSPNTGVWLMGLGISLQEEGYLSEAHEAFMRAQMSHDLNEDLKAFVGRRIRQISREID